MGIIYKVTNKITGLIYIGKTKYSLCQRFCGIYNDFYGHYIAAFKNNCRYKFHNALRKYGKENFNIEIIDSTEDLIDLNKREIFWIGYYDSYNNGYNMTPGGDSWTEYNKSLKGKSLDERFGITKSTKIKQKISNTLMGHKHSNETKIKIGLGNKGKNISEDSKKKMRKPKSDIGKNNIKQAQQFRVGAKWMHNLTNSKLVTKDSINLYLNNGWQLGRV